MKRDEPASNTLIRQIVIVVLLLVVLIALGELFGRYSSTLPQPIGQSTQAPVTKTISYKGETGKNVLELLQRDHKVQTSDSSIGAIPTSIDGIQSDNNSFWLYYIDGKQGTVAPADAQTQTGQTIEWRYQTLPTDQSTDQSTDATQIQ